ncbi:MAG: tetratricopeptide repeat protein, partial [Thermosynechococcaceae cyanobacterium]
MSKRRVLQEQKRLAKGPTSAAERLQAQINTLVTQKKYRQALEKFKQIRQTHPDIKLSPSEADIWMLQGQQEFAQNSYRQAEASFRQALDCGAVGEAHYWQAKTLLAQGQTDAALGLMQVAFETKVLPKDYTGCYLKLLLMQGQSKAVAELIEKQSKRFYMPQVHWARGVLALQAQNPKDALAHFQKMGRPATPNDLPTVWITYAHQCAGDWKKAESDLGLQRFSPFRMSLGTTLPRHPAMQRLAIAQAGHTSRSLSDLIDLNQKDLPQRETALVLALLEFIEKNDFHNAAHALRDLKRLGSTGFPQLDALRDPVLRMGGEQALDSDEPECTEAFWSD